jgi:MFS family permease
MGHGEMSACIIAAQLIRLPVALAVGATADRTGREPILLLGFAVLPIRAAHYTISGDAWWLIGVQLLAGIGARVFGAITPLLVAALTKGIGRYNLAQGVVATSQGIGASASGLFAGIVVDHFGYSATFLAMPETAGEDPEGSIIMDNAETPAAPTSP